MYDHTTPEGMYLAKCAAAHEWKDAILLQCGCGFMPRLSGMIVNLTLNELSDISRGLWLTGLF